MRRRWWRCEDPNDNSGFGLNPIDDLGIYRRGSYGFLNRVGSVVVFTDPLI